MSPPAEVRAPRVGDRVHVPGRFDRLTVTRIEFGRVLAEFESGHGFVDLPPHDFAFGWGER